MFIERHKFFRWTPRTAWITFAYAAVVPLAFFWLGSRTEVSVCPAAEDRSSCTSGQVRDAGKAKGGHYRGVVIRRGAGL